MSRNVAKPLSFDRAMRAFAVRDLLPEGEVVSVTYVKRDGSTSASAGAVMFHNGAEGMDTMSVTLDTVEAKGRASTVNLDGILTVNGQEV